MKPIEKTAIPKLERVSIPKLEKPAMIPMKKPTAMPKIKSIAEIQAEQSNPLDRNNEHYTNDAEHDSALDIAVIGGEFAEIRAARAQQAAAIELANDTEFWFAMYFQTREQCIAFCAHFGLEQDKYVDGIAAAEKMGVPLPKRPAPYKVGRVDKKLADLT